jgi:hypothetical protein
MRRLAPLLIPIATTLAACSHLPAQAQLAPATPVTAQRATLPAFRSDEELLALFQQWRERARKDEAARRQGQVSAEAQATPSAPAAKAAADESITNVQHAGVDEGGIVKVHGDHLVILRRGRLFTVAVGGQRLDPVSSIDAFAPGSDPGGTWYDEMLIAGDQVVVIGFSYARGGTELGLFDIGRNGQLRHRATYHLRSNDYYSSRNYASRLIGSKLVLYSPLYVHPYSADPLTALPAVRRWQPQATPADFKRIPPARRIYRADDDLDPRDGLAFHSVTLCDLAQPELTCESTAVLGPAGCVFYVSPTAVYVWASPWRRTTQGTARSAVYRIPLDGAAPTALKVAGSPIDQLSFLEADGGLNVLVRAEGRGEAMWAAETRPGALALLRIDLNAFGDGRDAAPADSYTRLPSPAPGALMNRYVGRYLVYGTGAGWGRATCTADGTVFAIDYAAGRAAFGLPIAHSVERIEALGRHALVVGNQGTDLHFTSLQLDAQPSVARTFVRRNAAQGETRTHGFFYRAETDERGLLGLPIVGGGEPASGQLRRSSASVLFLRNSSLALSEIGALQASPEASAVKDGCKASCVDWYGNSRPIFLRGRVFALMGYELVEGRLTAGGLSELRRTSFAPAPIEVSAR